MSAIHSVFLVLCVFASLREASSATLWIRADQAQRLSGPIALGRQAGVFEEGGIGDSLVSTICVSADKLDGGYAEYRVQVPREGNYSVWARCRNPSHHGASFVLMPTGASATALSRLSFAGGGQTSSRWHWDRAPQALALGPGEFTFRIYASEAQSSVYDPGKWRMANPLFCPRLSLLCLTTREAYLPSDADAATALNVPEARSPTETFRVRPTVLRAMSTARLCDLGKKAIPDWLRCPRLYTKDSWRGELEARRPGDIALMVRQIAANEGNAFRLSAYWGGNVFFQSRIAPHAPGLGKLDYLAEAIEAGRATGVKIVMYANPNGLYYDHPLVGEVAIRDARGQTAAIKAYGMEARYACLNHPVFRRFFLDVLREAFTRYELAGLYVDGLSPHRCFCRYCREAYEKMWGEPLPVEKLAGGRAWGVLWEMTARPEPIDDPASPQCRRYTQFLARTLAEATHQIAQTVKECRPGAVAIFHSWPKPDSIADYDGTLTEIYLNQPWRHKLWKSQELACYSNIFPVPVLFNIYLHDHGTEAEARLKMFQGLAAGCYPNCWNMLGMRSVFGFMRRNAEVLDFATTRPVPFLALVRGVRDDSAQERLRASKDLLQRPGGYFLEPYVGMYSALVRRGLPIVTLQRTDFHLSLSRFKVLVLANEACLSDEQVAAVRRFVNEGGALVATGETSLYNEQAARRSDFGLADVFGVSYQGMLPRAPRSLRRSADHPVSPEHALPGEGVSHDESCVAVRITGAKCIAVLEANSGPRQGVPAICRHEYGRGRVAYLPGRLEAIQCRQIVPAIEQIFAEAVAWASDAGLPVRIQASAPVSVGLFEQPERRILHLVSLNGDPEYRTDAVAAARNVHIDLAVPAGWRPGRLRRLWNEADVPYTVHNQFLHASLDRIDPYELLVLEPRR